MALEKKDYIGKLVLHFNEDGTVHAAESQYRKAFFEDGKLDHVADAAVVVIQADELNEPAQELSAAVQRVTAEQAAKRQAEAAEAEAKRKAWEAAAKARTEVRATPAHDAPSSS